MLLRDTRGHENPRNPLRTGNQSGNQTSGLWGNCSPAYHRCPSPGQFGNSNPRSLAREPIQRPGHVGHSQVGVDAHRQVDVGVPGQVLGNLGMNARGRQARNVLVP